MSNSPLFKRAFVRGLNSELIRQGTIVYPSKEAADASADFVADQSAMPDPYTQGEVLDIKVATVLCDYLIKAAEYQCEQAGDRYNPSVTKTAQATTPVDVATEDAWHLMEKAAAETGSLVEGGEDPNDEPAAAHYNAEAALDMRSRPQGYADMGERGVGDYEDPSEGTVGHQGKHPHAPGATDSGHNSLTPKNASLADIVRSIGQKTAAGTGSLITGGGNPNSLPAAARSNAEAALEQRNRPENYAHRGVRAVGTTEFKVPSGAVTGREQPHPKKPGATASGSNTIIAQTKNAFDQLFQKAASQIVPYLPENMDDNVKVSHVRAMIGLEKEERASYLDHLYVSLGSQKEAAEAVGDHFLKAAAHAEPDGDECPDDEEAEQALPPAMRARANEEEKKEAAEQPSNGLSGLRARLASMSY